MRDSPRLDVRQPATFDFAFCRDFVAEAIASHNFVTLPGTSLALTVDNLIKSMINFELPSLMDCAVDLAEHFRATLSPRFDVDEVIAHLIGPPPNPRTTVDVTECIRMIGALSTRFRQTEAECDEGHMPYHPKEPLWIARWLANNGAPHMPQPATCLSGRWVASSIMTLRRPPLT